MSAELHTREHNARVTERIDARPAAASRDLRRDLRDAVAGNARDIESVSPRGSGVLWVVLAAQAMAIIDLTIVNVAAPTVRRELHASGAALQLVVSGYVITYAMSLITGARLGDRLGNARVFRFGLVAFTLASLACGLAGDPAQLIIFRLIQGIGAGAMIPQVMSLVQRMFPGPERGKALGYYAAVVAIAAVLGQVLGGALVTANLAGTSWRPIFLVNVPIGAVLVVVSARLLPRASGVRDRRLDPLGVITSSAALVALVVPLVLGHQEGWPAWCWASLGASLVLFAVFAVVEWRVGAAGGSPLVPAVVVRAPGLMAGAGTLFLALGANTGFLFATALYLQGSLHLSALHTGLLFAATAVGTGISSLNWSRLPASVQRWLVPGGMAGAAIAFLLLAPIEHSGRLNSGWLVADLFAIGLFFGLAYSPVLVLALRGVPVGAAADASGVVVTMLQLGQVVGVAAIGTIYLSLVHSEAPGHAASTTFIAVAALAAVAVLTGTVLARTARSSQPEP
jgi:MFS family permease